MSTSGGGDADSATAYSPEAGAAHYGDESGQAAYASESGGGWSMEAPAAAADQAGGGEGDDASAAAAEMWGEWDGVVSGSGTDQNLTYRLSSPGGVAPTSEARHTSLSMGDEVPNFAGFSQMGRIEFHDYIAGGWSVLLTFARSFDPVSLTEIGQLAKLVKHFEARSVNVLGVVQDSVLMLSSYLKDVATIEQCKVDLPIVVCVCVTHTRTHCACERMSTCARRGSSPSSSSPSLRLSAPHVCAGISC
jgi:hypothetical protein